MRAIQTRYHGPTNTKGARISAFLADEPTTRATIPYDYALRHEALHFEAVKALAKKTGLAFLNDGSEVIAGGADQGYIFVFADSPRFTLPGKGE